MAFLGLLWLGVEKGARKERKTDGPGKGKYRVEDVRRGALGLLSPVSGIHSAVGVSQFVLDCL